MGASEALRLFDATQGRLLLTLRQAGQGPDCIVTRVDWEESAGTFRSVRVNQSCADTPEYPHGFEQDVTVRVTTEGPPEVSWSGERPFPAD